MVKGLYTAYTGLRNEQRRMDVISNNFANSNTIAYKKMGVTSQAFDREMALRIDDDSDAYLVKGLGRV
ncbi:MAG: flagellar basal body protein, partial [Lachnospiraceae bacterium]|nr:flagellar basal body protein [Lachnospiraceae bacterium]